MTFNEWAKAIHELAIEKGWWDEPREFGTVVALCHSELSEALEEYRNDRPMLYVENLLGDDRITDPAFFRAHEKPEGIAVEMVDCMIRILDYLGKEKVDVDQVLRLKFNYNRLRPHCHGGKKC
jgi:hypothetical protein